MQDQMEPSLSTSVRMTLTLGLVRATEAAALDAARGLGKGDADRVRDAAASAMLESLEDLGVVAHVAFGPRDNHILSRGATVGAGPGRIDLAAYPVEGAGLVARGLPGALSVVVAVEQGCFPRLPAVWYMDSLIAGPAARGALDLDDPLSDNLRRIAFSRDVRVSDLTVAVLDRPRHKELIQEIRSTGSRVLLIEEGEVAGALLAALDDTGVDAMVGISGLQETVIAACAVRCLGAELQAKLWPRNEEERELAADQLDQTFGVHDLAPDVIDGAVTGISGVAGISDRLLKSAWYGSTWYETESIAFGTESAAMRRITTRHRRPTEHAR
jgi:fructose-1,6-bisphosphatase II